jgi:transcription elongation factor Elf1
MFEQFIEHDTEGKVKGLTLEWQCPKCAGLNFRILMSKQRSTGEYHTRCRYCKAKYRVKFPAVEKPVPGEAEFMERLSKEDFSPEENTDMIKDFAEIEYMRVDNALPAVLRGKQKLLEEKIAFAKKQRRLQ